MFVSLQIQLKRKFEEEMDELRSEYVCIIIN